MKASNETRLRRIETDHGNHTARMFVIEGTTPEERDRYISGLVRWGEARATDSFIHTGVPRSRPRHTDHGPIPELLDRIAAHGSKIHDQRD
jgi:hypothetical protein